MEAAPAFAGPQIGQLEGDLVGLHDELEAKETSLMDLRPAHPLDGGIDRRMEGSMWFVLPRVTARPPS